MLGFWGLGIENNGILGVRVSWYLGHVEFLCLGTGRFSGTGILVFLRSVVLETADSDALGL